MRTTLYRQFRVSKLLLVFALLFGGLETLKAQNQIEIVIVGSAHGNGGTDDFYRPIIDKLKNYNPDMVFGEYLSPEDQKASIAAGHLTAKGINKRMAYLRARDVKADKKVTQTEKAYRSLNKFAYLHKTRMELARSLYLNHDRGNAEYQFYVLEQHMQDKFEQKEQAYFDKLFGGTDSLRKVGLIRKSSEYQRIYFPLIYELGHDRIYAADCQKYEADWNEAGKKAQAAIKKMNEEAAIDSTSDAGLAAKAMKTYYAAANARMKGVDYTSYNFLNSDLYAELDEVVNFLGGPVFFNEPGYPKAEIEVMLDLWEKRNQGICDNIVRQAKEKGATKVIVGVGASHRKGMEEIFAKMPDVKVINYNDLP